MRVPLRLILIAVRSGVALGILARPGMSYAAPHSETAADHTGDEEEHSSDSDEETADAHAGKKGHSKSAHADVVTFATVKPTMRLLCTALELDGREDLFAKTLPVKDEIPGCTGCKVFFKTIVSSCPKKRRPTKVKGQEEATPIPPPALQRVPHPEVIAAVSLLARQLDADSKQREVIRGVIAYVTTKWRDPQSDLTPGARDYLDVLGAYLEDPFVGAAVGTGPAHVSPDAVPTSDPAELFE